MPRWLSRLSTSLFSEPAAEPAQEAATPAFLFSDIEGPLALYVTALSDGALRVAGSGSANSGSFSDGKTIFFPLQLGLFTDPAETRRLYRLTAAWKVLQVRSGALAIEPLLAGEDPGRALALYEILHGEWLDRRLAAEFPGLAADLAWLRADTLSRGSVASEGSLDRLLQRLLAAPLDEHTLDASQLGFDPARLRAALAAETPERSRELALALARELPPANGVPPVVPYRGRIRVDLVRNWSSRQPEPEDEGRGASPPPENRRRREPLVVDIRPIEQRIQRERRARAGGRQAVQLSLGDREPTITAAQVPLSEAERRDALLYPEWDYQLNDYRPEWCAVHLRHPRAGSSEAVDRILRRNAALIVRLKQQFEALRPERQRLTRQLDGDELDLNALVEAHADRRAGFSPSEKLYSRTLERQRNIALACLIDLSGSTGAWIDDDPRNDQVIEVTRRAIVFLCEALTTLDDRYALYGFTSGTRKRCEVAILKSFEESYGETVRGRLAGMAPGSYTRIGPAVRHTTRMLQQQPARIRLLLLISDGRPNDFDGYGGRYGIEDTRRSLLEARQKGVATFSLTIDGTARDYMPYMFGRGNYVVVENTPALATRLPDIYRRLTVPR